MQYYSISLALAGLTLLVSCISQAPKTDHQHDDLEAHLLELNTVVIAPPDITIMRQHIGRKKTVFEQRERELQGLVAEIAQRELEQAGYDIVAFDFDAAIKQDQRSIGVGWWQRRSSSASNCHSRPRSPAG